MADISGYESEQEVLLPANSRMKVSEVRRVDRKEFEGSRNWENEVGRKPLEGQRIVWEVTLEAD